MLKMLCYKSKEQYLEDARSSIQIEMPYLNGKKYKEWMEGKTIIEKLITKYADKSLEEPS